MLSVNCHMSKERSKKMNNSTTNHVSGVAVHRMMWSYKFANTTTNRSYRKGKVVDVNIKHYQYKTEEEIRHYKKKIGVKNFNLAKPWFIRPGPLNTCLCVHCEEFRLAKLAVARNSKLLLKPYTKLFAVRTIATFIISIRSSCQYITKSTTTATGVVNALLKLPKFYYIYISNRCKVYNIYSICDSKYKSIVANRLMWTNALPRFGETSNELRGRLSCYGDCSNTLLQVMQQIKKFVSK